MAFCKLMRAQRISEAEYARLTAGHTDHIYNTVDFSRLNAAKCDEVHYIVMHDRKPRFAIVAGERAGCLLSPFSAPFGGLTAIGHHAVGTYRDAVDALRDYAAGRPVEITVPPVFYAAGHIERHTAAMLEHGTPVCADINYHYDLAAAGDIDGRMARNARNKLNSARRAGFEFHSLDTGTRSHFSAVYDVIRINHEYRGHPLRMSLDDILVTAPMMDCRLYVLTLSATEVAAAYLHHPAPGISQVVYWGDIPDYRHLRPMNMLAAGVFAAEASVGMKILDIGISSDRGIIDPGLCDFKESLGCVPTLRHTVRL